MLRSIAADLRKEAARRDDARRVKRASVLVAASGLGLLGKKLGVRHG